MNELDEREAFLSAIFDEPDNDLPRLVFADWLEERGDPVWAELIRVQCEIGRLDRHLHENDSHREVLEQRQHDLLNQIPRFRTQPGRETPAVLPQRGFVRCEKIEWPVELVADSTRFRLLAAFEFPEWHQATSIKLTGGPIGSARLLQALFSYSSTRRVHELDLSGSEEPIRDIEHPPFDEYEYDPEPDLLLHYQIAPVITFPAVEWLATARECRRLTMLDLRSNDLDNDAARALARSKNLHRLKKLYLFEGNRFRGRTWQEVLERYGPEVVE